MTVGLVLAVLPHLAWFVAEGHWDYLASGDDVLYLTLARFPYHGEPGLRDPFAPASRKLPSLYSDLQFVPASKLARALGLPPQRIGLLWRVVGGLLVGMSVYVVFRRLFRTTRSPTAFALGCSVIFLTDDGVITGRNVIQTFLHVLHAARSANPPKLIDGLGLYRVVTPVLNLPLLLLMAASLIGPWKGRRWPWIGLGIGCLALCVHLYFFYWTAAVVALAGLAGTSLLAAMIHRDDSERRERALWAARVAALVLAGGMAIGAPTILSNSRTFSSPEYRPILERSQRGRTVEPEDSVRWRYVGRVWNWGQVGLGTVAVCGLGMVALEPIWWLVVAGYGMTNSALVTGLEFENFHWFYVAGPFGEILVLGFLVLAIDRWWPWGRRSLAALGVIPLVFLAMGIGWRAYHAVHAVEARENTHVLDTLRPLQADLATLGPENILAGPTPARVALLFTQSGMLYQNPQSGISSLIPMNEVNERHALNAWLLGFDEETYRDQAGKPSFEEKMTHPAPELTAEVLARQRRDLFREIEQDPAPFLTRYRPDVLLLPGEASDPTRGGPWYLVRRTNHWTLWIKRATP